MAEQRNFSQALDEWTTWYVNNLNRHAGPDQKMKFLAKAMNGALHLFHLANIEIKKAQGSHSGSLWLPTSFSGRGDLTRFG